jgi:dienelactone hydrolase
MWVKDVRRTIDYLATRPDIDSSRLAYFGYSWGSILGPMMLALEQRLRVGVFFVGGIVPSRARPEVEVVNYLPRVKVPVLMVNGAGDPFFPPETTQQPMFLALGTKLEDKRHVVAEGGHFAPRALLIKETLGWLDRYLGPVR